jgi:hypothetical protein
MTLAERPRPNVDAPTDAIIQVTETTIRGTDGHIPRGALQSCQPGPIPGQEGVAVVDAVSSPTRSGVLHPAKIGPKRPITHRSRRHDIPDAYEMFARAPEAKALTVTIETAVA